MTPAGTSSERPIQSYVLPPTDAARGMVRHHVEVDPRDVVFIKSLVEASEGLASIFAERGGSLVMATPRTRAAALRDFLNDLEAFYGARVTTSFGPGSIGAGAEESES